MVLSSMHSCTSSSVRGCSSVILTCNREREVRRGVKRGEKKERRGVKEKSKGEKKREEQRKDPCECFKYRVGETKVEVTQYP